MTEEKKQLLIEHAQRASQMFKKTPAIEFAVLS
jgi:hypothetical protein